MRKEPQHHIQPQDRKNLLNPCLTRLYYRSDSPAAYGGLNRLWYYAKHLGFLKKDVKKWLDKQVPYTKVREISKKKKHFEPTYADEVDGQWQADLLDMSFFSRENKGVKYLLVVEDVLSRFALVQPLKNKKGPTVTNAFKKILKANKDNPPRRLQTDKGTEFYNSPFQKLLAKYHISHFSTEGDNKATLVERLNKTLKQKIIHFIISTKQNQYLSQLQNFVLGYNRAPHSAHGLAPQDVDVWNQGEVHDTLYGEMIKRWLAQRRQNQQQHTPKFQRGDHVRTTIAHQTFQRRYYGRWTEEIFKIAKVISNLGREPQFLLEELDGSPIKGRYYARELQKVTKPELFNIEKILKRRTTSSGQRQLYVKWKGYAVKYNSWIEADGVVGPPPAKKRKK